MGKKQFIGGETYDEMIETYMKYACITDMSEIDAQYFSKWVDLKRHKYLKQTYGEVHETDCGDFFYILDRYCKGNGCEGEKSTMAKTTSGVRRIKSQSLSNCQNISNIKQDKHSENSNNQPTTNIE